MPPIIEQNAILYKRAAAALDAVLGKSDYLVDNRFSATDIVVGYTVNWGREQKLLSGCPNLQAYLERLLAMEHCTLVRY